MTIIAIIINVPLCENGNLESLPIASNEGYKFDYVAKSGVILEFL